MNSHIQATHALMAFSTDLAVSTSRYRASVLKNFGDVFLADIRIKADESSTRDALEAFSAPFDAMPSKEALRRHYVEHTPPPGRSKADYLGQNDATPYALAHIASGIRRCVPGSGTRTRSTCC